MMLGGGLPAILFTSAYAPFFFGIPLAAWFGYKIVANSYRAYESFKGPDLKLNTLKFSPKYDVQGEEQVASSLITSNEGEIAIRNEGDKTFFFRRRMDKELNVFPAILALSPPLFIEDSPEYELIGFKDKKGDLYQVTGETKKGLFSNLWNSTKELISKVRNLIPIPFFTDSSHLPRHAIEDIDQAQFSKKLILPDNQSNPEEGFICKKISEFSEYKERPTWWEQIERGFIGGFSPFLNLTNEYRLKTIANNFCIQNEITNNDQFNKITATFPEFNPNQVKINPEQSKDQNQVKINPEQSKDQNQKKQPPSIVKISEAQPLQNQKNKIINI